MNAATSPALKWCLVNYTITSTANSNYFGEQSIDIWNQTKDSTHDILNIKPVRPLEYFKNKSAKNNIPDDAWDAFEENYHEYIQWNQAAITPGALYRAQLFTYNPCYIPGKWKHQADEYRAERRDTSKWDDWVMSTAYTESWVPKNESKWQ